MTILKIIAGLIFILLGILVFYRGIHNARQKAAGDRAIDLIAGIGFIIIGLLVWLGYIS